MFSVDCKNMWSQRKGHTFLMNRAISVESAASKSSSAFPASRSAYCCIACRMSVSPITAWLSSILAALLAAPAQR